MDGAIYARLSRNRRGLSDNTQIQIGESQAYAEEKVWPIVGTFADDDISASKYSQKPRPDYMRLVAAIEAGQVEVIICTEMTRLYRRLEELLELIKMAERTRLRGIWTTDDIGYDLSTPEGTHAAIAAINNAMLESAKLSKRIRRKKAVRARQGMANGGGRPYGYDKTGMELVPEEVALLVEAKDRYLARETEDEPDHTEALILAYQTAKLTLDHMVRDYATGFLNRDEFGVAKLTAEDSLQAARDNLAKYQSRQARMLLPARESVREAWEHAGLDWRRNVIKLLVDRIVVHPGLPGSMLWRGWRFDPSSIEVSWRV